MDRELIVGVAVGASMLISSGSYAATYSVSSNAISNFGVSFTNMPFFSAFPFNGNTAAVNGYSQSYGGVMNAAPSCVSCSYADSFVAHGPNSSYYAYGDSQILSDVVLAGLGSAKAMGEACTL